MANTKEDLQVDIGTKERAVWESVLKEAEMLLKQSQDNILIQEGMIQLAKQKIELEKAKFK